MYPIYAAPLNQKRGTEEGYAHVVDIDDRVREAAFKHNL